MMPGFDYRDGQAKRMARGWWKAQFGEILARGGLRDIRHGETFCHGPVAAGPGTRAVVLEVYGIVPAPKVITAKRLGPMR